MEKPLLNNENRKQQKQFGQVDRSHSNEQGRKVLFALSQLVGVVISIWISQFGGITTVGNWFGENWIVFIPARANLMTGAIVLYWCRILITMFYLLSRNLAVDEIIMVSIMMNLTYIGFAILACGVTSGAPTFGVIDYIAVVLILSGSFLNTYSELQRKWWKADPQNKGKCYTGGLWTLATHINYFGDVILFSGWTLLTATWWMFWYPLMIISGFVFTSIPHLDNYLEERYGEEFKEYSSKTKKLIPFVY
eukprot:CAMPEP_0115013216 /NCGR_PEP_ID=MMETSP0216-20121206/25261_1 /TAXON_ID=223996 /ORGANISM="Protocruzia adherens, Strain Boccale" /LENGTH=249 /DNA_ID=CAMNT_0002382543 /DNA_START=119 /DNA_END=868 /DNA_ORIENTATION=-